MDRCYLNNISKQCLAFFRGNTLSLCHWVPRALATQQYKFLLIQIKDKVRCINSRQGASSKPGLRFRLRATFDVGNTLQHVHLILTLMMYMYSPSRCHKEIMMGWRRLAQQRALSEVCTQFVIWGGQNL